jgi:hypothetical protein
MLLFANNVCRQSSSCGCVYWHNKYYKFCIFCMSFMSCKVLHRISTQIDRMVIMLSKHRLYFLSFEHDLLLRK